MEAAVSEKDDFYQAVNAKDLQQNHIRATEAGWDRFTDFYYNNRDIMDKKIMEIAAHQGSYKKGTPEQKIADLYQCAMDTEKRDAAARRHLKAALVPVNQAKTRAELVQAVLELRKEYGISTLLLYTVERDPHGMNYMARIECPDMRLSQQEMDKEAYPEQWAIYQKYIADLLVLDGEEAAAAKQSAKEIFALEKRLRPSLLSPEEAQDVVLCTRQLTVPQFIQQTPNLEGAKLVDAWGLRGEKAILTSNPALLKKMDEEFTNQNLSLFKDYIRFKVLDGLASSADTKLNDLALEFYNAQTGIAKKETLAEQNRLLVRQLAGQELGDFYAAAVVTPKMKSDIARIIQEVKNAYRDRLQQNPWLSEATRKQAIKKLDGLRTFIAAPDQDNRYFQKSLWDVTAEADGGDFLGNVLQNSRRSQEAGDRCLGKKVHLECWPQDMLPQVANAGYWSDRNAIVIPAGVLQAPFYSEQADWATNLGGIGVTIGHEISHAFDTNGAQYDENGEMRNWWTPTDYQNFQQRAKKFWNYYSAYVFPDGQHENGQLTVNENIADCSGLSVVSEMVGSDAAQLRSVYRNYANCWCQQYTPLFKTWCLQNEPHSIGVVRVNRALSSMEPFYRVFDI